MQSCLDSRPLALNHNGATYNGTFTEQVSAHCILPAVYLYPANWARLAAARAGGTSFLPSEGFLSALRLDTPHYSDNDDAVDIPHYFEEDEAVETPHFFEEDETVDTPDYFEENEGGILVEDMLDQKTALEIPSPINGSRQESFRVSSSLFSPKTDESQHVDTPPITSNNPSIEQNNNHPFLNSQSSLIKYDAPPSPPFGPQKYGCQVPGCTSERTVWGSLRDFRVHLEATHGKELPTGQDREDMIQL